MVASKDKMFKNYPVIIGNTPEIGKIRKIVFQLSCLNETVLIRGEPGTGKNLVANSIQYKSNRKDNPFIKINASNLSNGFFQSELFGYQKRDFVCLNRGRKEERKVVKTGTILFDCIEGMSAELQAKLIHILDSGKISKLENKTGSLVDVRVIAMTTANLEMLVEKGEFRKDLYHRLNVISIDIPPLRHRMEDIPLLADFFMDKFCMEFDKPRYEMSIKTRDLFCNYHWPGNIRELKNMVESAVIINNGGSMNGQFIQDFHIAEMPSGLFYSC